MARRKKGGGGEGGANWMDTYGDLVTLLLCFFVLLYSMSNMDITKWQYIAQAFSAGKGEIINVVVDEKPNKENDPKAVYVDEEVQQENQEIDFDDFYMYLKEAVASEGLEESVSVEMSQTGVYMKFRDSVFFKGDSAELLEEGQYILEVICDGLRAVDKHVMSIKVSGHTAESGTSDANEWDLSSGRADSVVKFMLSLDCSDPAKFWAAGYGKYRPVNGNDTEEDRKINRRVEILFVRNDIDFNDPAVVKELIEAEYGSTFVQYSDEDGEVNEQMEAAEEKESVSETPSRSDPDREYVSKEEAMREAKENPVAE